MTIAVDLGLKATNKQTNKQTNSRNAAAEHGKIVGGV